MSIAKLIRSAAFGAAITLATAPAWPQPAPAATAPTTAPADAPADAPAVVTPADAALSARFVELAQAILRGQTPDDLQFERAVTLLEGARRLNPGEARHLRLLADALVATNDTAALRDVIIDYRKLPGRVDDRIAQLEFIDLTVARFQTVDERLDFLRDLLGRDALAKEVRSAVALRVAALAEQKKQTEDARRFIEQAVALEPTNLAALQAKWEMTAVSATPAQRLSMALAMIKSNPRQVGIITSVAAQLAAAGFTKESVDWYGYAFTATTRQGQPIPAEVAVDAAAQLYLNGQFKESRVILERLQAAGQAGYPALVLRLMVEREGRNQEEIEKLLTTARNMLVNQVQTARSALGVKGATTQPLDAARQAAPDLGGDVALLKEAKDPAVREAYLQAVGDLAWFEVFFMADPPSAGKLTAVLSAVQDPANQDGAGFLARLEGWMSLRQAEAGMADRAQDARTKLTAVAERDPLAELGLIRLLAASDMPQARTRAHKLLSAYPGGILGAILIDSLRESGVIPVKEGSVLPAEVRHANAPALAAELAAFPADFMRILDAPQMFYTLRVEPMRVRNGFGEPLMVRVTLQNNSQYDLTIGDNGAIRQELWFDAVISVGAAEPRALPNIAVDRITEQTVLRPRQSLSRLVRIDQAELAGLLFLNPTPPILFRLVVKTNPIPTPRGAVPGLCGYGVEMVRPMERSSSPFNEANVKRAAAAALAGEGTERLRALDLITSFSLLVRRGGNAENMATADALLEPVRKSRLDEAPSLRAWSGFLLVAYGPEAGRAQEVEKLLADPAWQVRMMGLMLSRAMPEDQMKQALGKIVANDPDALVKRSAKATLEYASRPPATQPATQPGQPGERNDPAGPIQPRSGNP